MQIFIWKQTGAATWREHDEAGVVIIGANLQIARAMFMRWQKEHNCYDERCGVYLLAPDDVMPTIPRDGVIYVFPNAGCC